MRILSMAVCMSLLAAGPVLAQDADCRCLGPAPVQGALGQISELKGQVLVSQEEGMSPAMPGTPLFDGSQIAVGPQSSASLGLGDCSMTVASNSDVEIRSDAGQMCVRVTDMPSTASTPPTGEGNPKVAAGLAAAGTAIVVVDQVNAGKKQVSQ